MKRESTIVTVDYLRKHLGKIIDEIVYGDKRVIVTKRGQPMACIDRVEEE